MKETKFKQTEVGMIPSDWEVKKVSDVAFNFTGLTYTPFDVRDYGTLVLRSSNIQNEQLCFFDNVYVDMDIPERALVKDGDILVCVRNGSKALIGKSALVSLKGEKIAFGAFMTILRAKENVCNIFLLYSWQSNLLQNQVQESLGATINQITNSDFQRYYIALPPTIEEQQRIANALSDVDTLINNLEKLIAKKKNIKQGAMQQLLTGKKRLPGFAPAKPTYKQTELGKIPTDWEIIFIKRNYFLKGRIGWQGLKASEFKTEGPYLVTGTDFVNGRVNWETCYHITEKRYEEDPALHVQLNDLLITKDGTVGKVAYIDKKPEKVSLNSHLLIIRPLRDFLNNKYLYYVLNSPFFETYFNQVQTGTTMASLSQAKISEFSYPLPSFNEQTAIANILSDMDTEIATLETKLAKYRKLKTGMMQQLLTGKIRLV